MKRNDDLGFDKGLRETPDEKGEITSASVENAHATGDGAVQKTDELLPNDDENKNSTETNPY